MERAKGIEASYELGKLPYIERWSAVTSPPGTRLPKPMWQPCPQLAKADVASLVHPSVNRSKVVGCFHYCKWRDVGGFLGAGEKDVAVPFDAVHAAKKGNNDWYLVMNSSKDALKNAKGFKYDRNAMTWIPEDQARTTTGSGTNNSAPAPRPNAR